MRGRSAWVPLGLVLVIGLAPVAAGTTAEPGGDDEHAATEHAERPEHATHGAHASSLPRCHRVFSS